MFTDSHYSNCGPSGPGSLSFPLHSPRILVAACVSRKFSVSLEGIHVNWVTSDENDLCITAYSWLSIFIDCYTPDQVVDCPTCGRPWACEAATVGCRFNDSRWRCLQARYGRRYGMVRRYNSFTIIESLTDRGSTNPLFIS